MRTSFSKSLTRSQRLPLPEKPAKKDVFIEPYAEAGVIHPTTDLMDDRKLTSRTSAHNISRITVYLDNSRCWGLQVYYRIPGRPSEVTSGPSIGVKAPMETKSIDFVLEDDEYLTEIYGAANQVISEIGFRTSKAKYTTFGCPDIDARLFKLKAPPAHHFKVLISGSGENLQYIGAEVRPIEPPQYYLDAPRKEELEKSRFMRSSCNLSQMKHSTSLLSVQLRAMTDSQIKIPSAANRRIHAENPYFKGKKHPSTVRESESRLLALSLKSKISRINVSFNNTYVTALQFLHSSEMESDVTSQGIASSLLNMASTEEIFELGSDEYLIEINGTLTDNIMSFGFVTSKGRKEGPFGGVEGTPFKMRAPKGFHIYVVIVGAGDYIHNIETKVALIPIEHMNTSRMQILPPPTVIEVPIKQETDEFSLPQPLTDIAFNQPASISSSVPPISMTKSTAIGMKDIFDITNVEEKAYMCKDMNFREKCREDRM